MIFRKKSRRKPSPTTPRDKKPSRLKSPEQALEYARSVRCSVETLPTLSAKIEFLIRCRSFRVDQRKPEFMEFLKRIEAAKPSTLLEIGGRGGGTALLLSAVAGPSARVVSVDINYDAQRLSELAALSKGYAIEFWQADSHAPETRSRLAAWLGGEPLSVLFIDGDHSYEGVRQDFESFGPLVADGGLVVFHDIQPDYQQRFGVQTPSCVDGVPRFWSELKEEGFVCEELISDPEQDGYGIGILSWSTVFPNDARR